MSRKNFFHYKRMATILPWSFEPDVELVKWKLSPKGKRITGVVLHGPSSLVERQVYKDDILSILYQHGHVLIRTDKYDIICWSGYEAR